MIDLDGKKGFPNLALCKLSAYHKDKGDTVDLSEGNPNLAGFLGYDKAYISSTFNWSKDRVEEVSEKLPIDDVEIGGYGYNNKVLPDNIEHRMPDYDLYPDMDFSMGYTTRGCIRSCDFCDVSRREGCLKEWSPLDEFLHPDHDSVLLLDNNFLASSSWKDKLQRLNEEGWKISITQGLDARLIDEEGAEILADSMLYNWRFTRPAYFTAWDFMENEDEVLNGIENLLDAGVLKWYIRVYVLVGYNTSLEDDLYRFRRLRELEVEPFIMPYNNMDHPLKRWGQRPAIYKKSTFEEYAKEKLVD